MSGHPNVIKLLIGKGLPIDEKADFPDSRSLTMWKSITPLGIATLFGQIEAVKTFVDVGANVNEAFPNKWNPLSMAIVRRNQEIVAYLLQKKATLGENINIKNWNTSDEIKAMLKAHYSKEIVSGHGNN
jgi:ankyrin repeat protein